LEAATETVVQTIQQQQEQLDEAIGKMQERIRDAADGNGGEYGDDNMIDSAALLEQVAEAEQALKDFDEKHLQEHKAELEQLEAELNNASTPEAKAEVQAKIDAKKKEIQEAEEQITAAKEKLEKIKADIEVLDTTEKEGVKPLTDMLNDVSKLETGSDGASLEALRTALAEADAAREAVSTRCQGAVQAMENEGNAHLEGLRELLVSKGIAEGQVKSKIDAVRQGVEQQEAAAASSANTAHQVTLQGLGLNPWTLAQEQNAEARPATSRSRPRSAQLPKAAPSSQATGG
ncbi:unnamed protein product, partial [Amoebophrya sp. A25]